MSDFSFGRGEFLAGALALLGLRVVRVTNRPVYQKGPKSVGHAARVEFDVPFGRALYASVIGRLLFYAAFSAIAFGKLLRARPAVLYSRGPQPFTEITCLAYKLLYPRSVLVSDTTDLWPDSLRYVKVRPVVRTILTKVGLAASRKVYARVDAIVTHNEEMARILEERFHRPVFIIFGAVDLSLFGRVDREQALDFVGSLTKGTAGKFVVLYAGLLGPFQNPLALLEIAERLDVGMVILVVGRGPLESELRKKAQTKGGAKIVFVGTQPFESMPYFYGAADVCMLTYADLPFLKIGLPKKFIEYAASERPILCVAPECVAGTLCEEWGAGHHVGPTDFDGAARILIELRRDAQRRASLGRNARAMAEGLFSEPGASRTLARVLRSVEDSGSPRFHVSVDGAKPDGPSKERSHQRSDR